MQTLSSSSNELVNDFEEVLKDCEEKKPKLPRRRLNKKRISVPELVHEEDEENLDDFVEPTTAVSNDKVGKKRQRKEKDESGLERTKNKKKKKKKQDSVRDDLENSLEINEMWDSITNNNNNNNSSKDGDSVAANRSKKNEVDDEIEKLFKSMKKKSKAEKNNAEIAMQVEQVMANLELAVEDDVELNKEGKPAINKLMKLPLLTEALSKKPLQAEFLDHGVLNLLKNWLEPLPDGSLPNINIRTAVLKILNDLRIVDVDQQHCRREQLIKSGLGKVIMFLSKSDEETTFNRRLAHDLVNKWGRIIYDKSTRYKDMYSQEEREEHQQMLLRRQNKTAPKVYETKARDFDIDVDFSEEPKSKLARSKEVGRARVPTAISMDFSIRPKPKFDKDLEARARMQMDNKSIHEKVSTVLL
ncbi:hypothetical protein EUTSA_v10027557mg [Eutrema salsugineum]|uniref:TFIIS N-terminal domain-containing protein n=1 Tax=Eutrema salsugineum TaxID=72664 RepID=V4LXV1_EUTSA|nr:hypothetical protein EUTSA_v10027557mg [Eutrema salsugineum]